MANMPIVMVVWDDAHGSAVTEITEKDFPHHPMVMQTIGWLLRDDATGVSLANERCSDNGAESFRGFTFVPKSLVKSVTPIVKPHIPRKRAPKAPSQSSRDRSADTLQSTPRTGE